MLIIRKQRSMSYLIFWINNNKLKFIVVSIIVCMINNMLARFVYHGSSLPPDYFNWLFLVNMWHCIIYVFFRGWIKLNNKYEITIRFYRLEKIICFCLFNVLTVLFFIVLSLAWFFYFDTDILCFAIPWLMLACSYDYVSGISKKY